MDDVGIGEPKQIWVTTEEAAALSGYSLNYVRSLAHRLWRMPEEERPIRLVKHPVAYLIWLPDLIIYAGDLRRGPRRKDQNT